MDPFTCFSSDDDDDSDYEPQADDSDLSGEESDEDSDTSESSDDSVSDDELPWNIDLDDDGENATDQIEFVLFEKLSNLQ